jgi:hypothetical protein
MPGVEIMTTSSTGKHEDWQLAALELQECRSPLHQAVWSLSYHGGGGNSTALCVQARTCRALLEDGG